MAYGVALLQVGWLLNMAFTLISVVYVRYSTRSTHGVYPNCDPNNDPNVTCGSYYNTDNRSAWNGFSMWYTIASFYWTGQVIRNLAHFTTAGAVASWWLVSEVQSPTWAAFKRAGTSSLGTIAVGSILVALIEVLRVFMRQGGCIADCLCRVVRRAVRWFNKYAFIISAMYGSTYFDSAKHVSSLMSAKFWELLGQNTYSSATVQTSALFIQQAV